MSEPSTLPVYKAKTYCVHDNPYVYASCTNFEPGKGMIVIHSDWGTYSSYWGSMGGRTIEEFLLDVSSDYVEKNLMYKMNYMGVKKEAFVRLTKFMAHCWPKLREVIKTEMEKEGQNGIRLSITRDQDAPVAP